MLLCKSLTIMVRALVIFFLHAFTACEFLGGKLATLFGLNEPKYQYAIDEYYRTQSKVNKIYTLLLKNEKQNNST